MVCKKEFWGLLMVLVMQVSAHGKQEVSTLVSKDNPLYTFEIEGRTVVLPEPEPGPEEDLYARYRVSGDKSIGENFKNLIITKRLFVRNSTSKSLKLYVENAEQAHTLYPDNGAITCVYSFALHYENKENLVRSIALLIPFIQEVDENPGIYRAIRSFFSSYIDNEELIKNNVSIIYSHLETLLGTSDPDQILADLKLMNHYWGTKINPEYSSEWTKEKIGIEMEELQKAGGKEQAFRIWQKLLHNINKEQTHETELLIKRQKEKEIWDAIALRVSESERKQELLLEEAIGNCKVFESLPNSFQEIESTLSKMTDFQTKINKQYTDIPNYNKLKEVFAGSNEAEVINIAFKVYLLRDYENCLDAIDRINNNEEDPRLLTIKIGVLQTLGMPDDEILNKLVRLLELEPNNERAFMMKRVLEARIELQNRINGKR